MSFSDEQAKRLAAPLDAKRIKQRAAGNGNKLSYIETHDAIRTANEIFGFGKWGHRVENLNYLGAAPVKNLNTGKEGIHVGYLCTVALSVEGCAVTSGIGYGDATEYRPTAHVTAHELAAKEAESDALKRALKNYGDQFGLALYAKDALTAGHVGSAARTDGNRGSAADTGQRSPQAAGPDDPGSFVVNFSKNYKGRGLTLAQIYYDENDQGFVKWVAEKSTFEDAKQAAVAYLVNPTTPNATGGVGQGEDIPFAPTITGYGL